MSTREADLGKSKQKLFTLSFCLLCKWASALYRKQAHFKLSLSQNSPLLSVKPWQKKAAFINSWSGLTSTMNFVAKKSIISSKWPQTSWAQLQRATWLRHFPPCSYSWGIGSSEFLRLHLVPQKELLVLLETESFKQLCWSQYHISGCVQTWISNLCWTSYIFILSHSHYFPNIPTGPHWGRFVGKSPTGVILQTAQLKKAPFSI